MKFYIVDVFAEEKYQGNQLAVIIPDRTLSDSEMQSIAAEINFSETTFIISDKQDNGGYDVRIFTPDLEVPFAGHPTLGTAFIIDKIIEKNTSGDRKVILNYKVGPITVDINETGYTMTQNPPLWEDYTVDSKTIADIFNLDVADIDTDFPIESVSTGLPCLIVPLKTVDAVKKFTTNKLLYKKHYDNGYNHNILLFARDGENIYDRVIMPDKGICEDPATGSGNGNLAAYLLEHDYFGTGSKHLKYNVKQGYEINRPSLLKIEVSKIDEKWDVKVGGNVYLVASGEWN